MSDQDSEHLRLLAIFHYIIGGFGALFSLVPVLYLALGIAVLKAPENKAFRARISIESVIGGADEKTAKTPKIEAGKAGADKKLAEELDKLRAGIEERKFHQEKAGKAAGWILIAIALFSIFIGLGISFCIILSGYFLWNRKNRLYSFVIACLECLFFPLGTVLGVFAIIVLSRSSVIELYEGQGMDQ
jgi:hypothetical protein